MSTYERGEVLLLSSKDAFHLQSKSVPANRPLGLSLDEKSNLIIAEKTGISRVNWKQNIPMVMEYWPTGSLDLHDLFWCHNKALAVNTKFNRISWIDHQKICDAWLPFFIDKNNRNFDACHLNGMAVYKNQVIAATALGHSTAPQGWRDNILEGGILMDTQDNKMLLEGLGMPHSPRYINGKVFFLQSAFGFLSILDIQSKQMKNISIGGLLRGLSFFGDYAFIGRSKIRKNSKTFAKLPEAHRNYQAGVVVFHLPSEQIVSECILPPEIEETYDVLPIPMS